MPLLPPAQDGLLPFPLQRQPYIAGSAGVLPILLLHPRKRDRFLRRAVRLIIFEMPFHAGDDLLRHQRDPPFRAPSVSAGNLHPRARDIQDTGDLGVGGRPDLPRLSRAPSARPCYLYNARENRLEPAEAAPCGEHTLLKFTLEPRKSLIVHILPEWDPAPSAVPHELKIFQRSRCRAIDYPVFGREVPVSLPDRLPETAPAFSGYVRYRTPFTWSGGPCTLVISGPAEGVEVFVNGKSAGRQIVRPAASI